MALKTVTAGPDGAEREPDREVLFEPFAWMPFEKRGLPDEDVTRLADLAEATQDVAAGVADILAIIDRDRIDGACGDEEGKPLPAMLSASIHGNLTRLAIRSLDLLARSASRVFDRVNDATAPASRRAAEDQRGAA